MRYADPSDKVDGFFISCLKYFLTFTGVVSLYGFISKFSPGVWRDAGGFFIQENLYQLLIDYQLRSLPSPGSFGLDFFLV